MDERGLAVGGLLLVDERSAAGLFLAGVCSWTRGARRGLLF